jgi:2-polyprenyl-6-hydroxyphenyl methylase/3-demethylubiquinone-9 3-methyltransferase
VISHVPILSHIANKARAAAQLWAPAPLKRALWNKEFARGRWDNLADTPGDPIYAVLERHARNGSVLDLGCGSGNTSCELDSAAYSAYVGVDISDVALKKAAERSAALGRSGQNQYVQSDIQTYQPERSYDVILFRESLYYIPQAKIKATLDHYRQHLTPQGVFVVRCYDLEQGRSIAQLIATDYQVVEQSLQEGLPAILVFR